jgi:hypothetical protein
MTTITIDRKLLEEIVELFDDAISTRYPHEILRDIRAALAAPATAPKHNPDCRTCQKFINAGDGCVTVAKCEIGSMYSPVSPIYLWETL